MIGDTVKIEVFVFEDGVAVTKILSGIIDSGLRVEDCEHLGLNGEYFSVLTKNNRVTFVEEINIIGNKRVVLTEKKMKFR